MKRARLAVFASGSGSNYQAIVEACKDGRIDADVVLLVWDKPGAKVLERAKIFGTESFAFNPKDYASREEFETVLANMMDERGVDFGEWRKVPMSALYLPLDVHTGNMGRALGLLTRNSNDWKAVTEITSSLRNHDADDPVKYDFALFGAGIEGFLK